MRKLESRFEQGLPVKKRVKENLFEQKLCFTNLTFKIQWVQKKGKRYLRYEFIIIKREYQQFHNLTRLLK